MADNYKIIMDEEKLQNFLNWLPVCNEFETYYFCLFARSKYCKDENGNNKIVHIKTDKNQMKRFLATPDWAMRKIRQLECEFGSYLTKDLDPIPQEALALYVTPNPRHQQKAMIKVMKRYIDIIECQGRGYNITSEAMSAVQKSKSRTHVVDFDIDTKDVDLNLMKDILPDNAYNILETRGGYHLLIKPGNMSVGDAKNWYQRVKATFPVDQAGDQMIPVPGTYQGGFTPRFIH